LKQEQTVWLFIVILVIFLAAMPYMIITLGIPMPTAEYALGQPASDNKSEANDTVDIGVRQTQSGTGKQTNISAEASKVTHPKVCVEQWRQELITMEDTLRCIDGYMKITNG
jgi:hypothetical protein